MSTLYRKVKTPEGEVFVELTLTEVREYLLDSEMTAKVGRMVTSPDTAKEVVSDVLSEFDEERFIGIYLNGNKEVISWNTLAVGTIDTASVHPREVVKACMERGAASCIFAHNHPSGSSVPSMADRRITRVLADALNILNIQVLDHIVVAKGDEEPTSFSQKGWI